MKEEWKHSFYSECIISAWRKSMQKRKRGCVISSWHTLFFVFVFLFKFGAETGIWNGWGIDDEWCGRMGREERTFIDGHLSLHHVDVFERQGFYHFICCISRQSSQCDIWNIIRAQEEIDAESNSFSRELIARDIVYPSQGGILETIASSWIEDITTVAGNRTFERLHVVRARFLTAVELQYGCLLYTSRCV